MDKSTLQQGPDLDHLLADWVWLGELAARIVRDAGLREDARQAAWLSVAKGQSGSSPRRARLYWAVKQFASNARLADRRRVRRERVAARREALPSTEELVHRGEQRQRVWDALMKLPEPLRGTLVLHYQDGLSPAEIASRSDEKTDTVRRRIQRGVRELRERLDADRERGGVLALAAAIPRSRADVGGFTLSASSAGLTATLLTGTIMLAKTLCAIGAVAALFFAVRAISQSEVLSGATERQTALVIEEGPASLGVAPEPDEPLAAAAPTVAQRTELLLAKSPVEASPVVATWSGTVVVHDAEGNVVSEEMSGTLSASISVPIESGTLRSRGSIRLELPIQAGRFEVAVTENDDGDWGCWDLNEGSVVDGEGASPSELLMLVISAESAEFCPLVLVESASSMTVQRNRRLAFGEEDVVFHVRIVDPVIIHVVDSRNPEVQLEQVTVTAGTSGTDRSEITDPKRRTTLASGEASPIVVRPELAQASEQSVGCFFYSPGYARKRVEFDLSNGGERTVELEPGGELQVNIQGTIPEDSYLRVRVEDESWAPFANLRAWKEGGVELTGLPLGKAKVSVEKGSFFGQPIVLAEEEVLIQAGARASLSLVAQRLVTPLAVEVAGEFLLPVAWDEEHWRIRMRRVSPSTGSEDESSYLSVDDLEAPTNSGDSPVDVYAFSAGKLVPGDYVATIEPVELKRAFTVPPGGLVNLRIEVPPPARLIVTVRDSATGEISDLVKSVSWLPVYEGPIRFTTYPSADRDEATRTFEFNVPEGPVKLGAHAREIGPSNTRVDAVDGLAVDLEVTRVALARVEYQYEGRHVPWPSDAAWELPCKRMDGEGEVLSRGSNQAGIQFSVTAPGRYRLTLPKADGFQQPEPVEFEMTVDEVQKVVVPLTPE